MTTNLWAAAVLLVLTAGGVSGACGRANAPGPGPVATRTPDAPPAGGRSTDITENVPEKAMRIEITISGQRVQGTLRDSAASRGLVAQLPATLTMIDHGGVEKTGRLPSPLSLEGQPAGADPGVGDIGYYAPGNDFVLYYGDQSYYDGIVILGRMDGDAARRIADMDGSVTATIALVDE